CAICDIGGYLIAERSLKRDSIFEVGWLISEHPTQADYTQHVAYRPDQQHNLFTMGIRSAVYGGVMRFDLDRIGHNDWWWLQQDGKAERWPVPEDDRKRRARALLTAVKQWLLSPSGARQAGWLQHQGDPFEGILVLSRSGPAPFVSPIALEVADGKPRVKANANYRTAMQELVAKDQEGLKSYEFSGQAELVQRFEGIFKELGLA
ncbi:MAG: DevR family CRISPR-associated autoregulator, partial [Chloroflexota bacterium]